MVNSGYYVVGSQSNRATTNAWYTATLLLISLRTLINVLLQSCVNLHLE